jgi:transcriptional regulator with XRE-family HTH domain
MGPRKDDKRNFRRAIGSRVRDMRKLRSLSQSKLGALCDMKAQAIGRIECGEVIPNIYTLLRIARGLRMELDCLIPEGY